MEYSSKLDIQSVWRNVLPQTSVFVIVGPLKATYRNAGSTFYNLPNANDFSTATRTKPGFISWSCFSLISLPLYSVPAYFQVMTWYLLLKLPQNYSLLWMKTLEGKMVGLILQLQQSLCEDIPKAALPLSDCFLLTHLFCSVLLQLRRSSSAGRSRPDKLMWTDGPALLLWCCKTNTGSKIFGCEWIR